MEVFVGNLHDSVAYRDVALLFKEFKQPQVNLVETAQADGTPVRYAVVTFDSERLAKKAISRFDGHTLRGQPIMVREFIHRTYVNERRALDWRRRSWSEPERRRSDRRKGQRKPAPDARFDVSTSPPAPAPARKEAAPGIRKQSDRGLARQH